MEQLIIKTVDFSEDDKNVYVEGYASASVKDLDGEIISEEALQSVARKLPKPPYNKIFLNHQIRDIPIAKIVDAQVREVGGKTKLWIKIVLNKAHPQFEAVYKSLKEGFLDAFSIGFQALEVDGNVIKKLRILEVSLVGVPANPEAVVEEVYEKMFDKSEDEMTTKGVVPGHPFRYGKSDAAWSAPTLKDFTSKSWGELSAEEKRMIAGHFAWAPQNPPERFTDLKLPHHDPKSHAVVWRGVTAAMAALMGARGGVDIPADDRRKVYNHLAAHYREFNNEPPEFKTIEEYRLINEEFEEFDDKNLRQIAAKLSEHLKSLSSEQNNMEVDEKIKQLEAEVKRLTEENEKLKSELAAYEEKEKAEMVEKVKKAAALAKFDIDEDKLKEADISGLKIFADIAEKLIEDNAEKVKTPVDSSERFIETKFGKVDVEKLKEIKKAMGLEVE